MSSARAVTVVHAITRLELGGAQENTLYTCQRLDRSRFEVILAMGPGGMLDDEAHASDDLTVIDVPELVRSIDLVRDPQAFARLKGLFSDLLYEHRRRGCPRDAFIVHTHSSKAGILGRFAARAAGVPWIVHTIHGFGFHAGQSRLKKTIFVQAERLAGRVTDAFIGVSEANLEEARGRGIIRPGQLHRLIRSGMDLEPFRALRPRAEARRAVELDLAPDAEVIVSVANFKPQKDPLTLIEGFRRLAERRPRAVLVYAGDGVLRGAVEQAIAAAGLKTRVRLAGWRRDVPLLLAAADVVALSSIFEGLPRSAVQAVAARRPFVGTWVDGTPEIIRDGENGFLVPPRDPRALAAALERALEAPPVDPSDVERIRAWDADAMVQAQAQLYEELIDRGR